MRIAIFIPLYLCICMCIQAQEELDFRNNVLLKNNLKIPSSPEAKSLGEYGDFPFNAYTGTANINIPVYNIEGNIMSDIIILSRSVGSIKVQDEGTWVGIGQTLQINCY